jgi:colanic acid biosynthesis glycosyl transferase WcaI
MESAFVGIVPPCEVYNILAVGAPSLYIGPKERHITDLLADLRGKGSVLVSGHKEVESVIGKILAAAQHSSVERSHTADCARQFSPPGACPADDPDAGNDER